MSIRRSQMQRRAEPREPVRIAARLAYGPQLALWADCTIMDVSQSGAKVKVDAVFGLPPRLVLTNLQSGIAFDVIVKWRRGDLAGLQLQTRHDLNGEVEARLDGVKATWMALRIPSPPPVA